MNLKIHGFGGFLSQLPWLSSEPPWVAARIAEEQTGVVTSLDKLTADHLSTLLDEVLNDST